jgi:glycosyltransferase involved in cell wall biosynthesis
MDESLDKVKILFVAPSNSVHTKRWLERASSSGINVLLYDLYEGIDYDLPYVRHSFQFNEKSGVFHDFAKVLFHYKKLKEITSKEDIRLIHLHWLFHQAPFAATFLRNIPIIATSWGSDVQVNWKPLKDQYKKKIINFILVSRIAIKSSAICCDSIAQKKILIRRGGWGNKIKIIYFGTNVDKFNKIKKSPDLRKRLGARENHVLVLSNRNHELIYDIQTFLRAAKMASEVNPELKFVVAGSGSLTHDLKKLSSELGLDNCVSFPGKLNDEDFASLSATCDIYVSTSSSDGGLAASTAEAMSSSTPVIVSNFGENSRWLKNETAGLIFEIGDHKELSKKILRLSWDVTLRDNMGRKGRQVIELENNSKVEWLKVEQMYKLTIGRRTFPES